MSFAGRIALLLLLLCIPWFAYSDGLGPPTPSRGKSDKKPAAITEHQGNTTKRNLGDSESGPIFVKVLKSPETEEERAHNAAKENRETTFQWWQIGIGVGTAIVLVLQFLGLMLQAWTSSRQIRAWIVAIPPVFTHQDLQKSLRFRITACYQNSGQSPALNVKVISTSGIIEYPLSPERNLDESLDLIGNGITLLPSHQTLGPQQTGTSTTGAFERILTNDEIERAKHLNQIAFYTWGKITYRDVFYFRHTTKFCLYLVFDTNGNPAGWNNAPRYNQAD